MRPTGEYPLWRVDYQLEKYLINIQNTFVICQNTSIYPVYKLLTYGGK